MLIFKIQTKLACICYNDQYIKMVGIKLVVLVFTFDVCELWFHQLVLV